MSRAPLKTRAVILAVIAGVILALPVTALLLHASYNHSGISNGPWSTHPDAGSADSSALVRAAIARYAFGSNTIEEAIYWHAENDSQGEALQSGKNYIVLFPGEPDVSEFWSLTLYDEEGRLSLHPAEHYSVNNSMPLNKKADGSFEVLISREAPTTAINWLSAPPSGNFSLLLRYYGPSRAVLDALETTPLPSITQPIGGPLR